METPKQIKETEADEARLRQAEPMHFPHGLVLRDPPEMGWVIIEQLPDTQPKPDPPPSDLAPNIRHINRTRHGMQWLGPAILKPNYDDTRPTAA